MKQVLGKTEMGIRTTLKKVHVLDAKVLYCVVGK